MPLNPISWSLNHVILCGNTRVKNNFSDLKFINVFYFLILQAICQSCFLFCCVCVTKFLFFRNRSLSLSFGEPWWIVLSPKQPLKFTACHTSRGQHRSHVSSLLPKLLLLIMNLLTYLSESRVLLFPSLFYCCIAGKNYNLIQWFHAMIFLGVFIYFILFVYYRRDFSEVLNNDTNNARLYLNFYSFSLFSS